MSTKTEPLSLSISNLRPEIIAGLQAAKTTLEAAIEAPRQHAAEIQARETQRQTQLQKIRELDQRAAQLDAVAEAELATAKAQLARLDALIRQGSDVAPLRISLFEAIAQADSVILVISRHQMPKLLDRITDAIAPFFVDRGHAKQVAQATQAFNEFHARLVMEDFIPRDSILETLLWKAQERLARVEALLEGRPYWTFPAVALPSMPTPDTFRREHNAGEMALALLGDRGINEPDAQPLSSADRRGLQTAGL